MNADSEVAAARAYIAESAPMRLTARVEEQHDADGDLVWAVSLAATTHSRHMLDWFAETLGCELEFVPEELWAP
jgi:hypothetical protein